MALYNLKWKRSASKELRKLPKPWLIKIISVTEALRETPFPKGYKKIMGTEHTYRIRVGDYRVVYSIESDELVIDVIRVGHRQNIYKNLS